MTEISNIFRALIFYRELFELLEIYFRGYLVITTDNICITYLKLCNKMEEILNEPPFKEQYPPDWRPFDNLRNLDQDLPQEEWEYSGNQTCNKFLSYIETLYIKNGGNNGSLTQDEEHFLMEIQANIGKYKSFKNRHEQAFIQRNFPNKSNWNDGSFWSLIHKDITAQAKKRFDSGHYADAVESACKELIYRVKSLYKHKTDEELDGTDLMFKAFRIERSNPNPVLCLDDISTDNGRNIQDGYMHLFAGTVSGIRNPKAHKNIEITPERAIHMIFLVSLLMHKLDEAEKLNSIDLNLDAKT